MKFVIAPDSFKGSLTAKEVALAIKEGISKIFPHALFELVPMADGGEGTVQSLVDATHGTLIQKKVTGPLENKVTATYGLLGDKKTAVIEMSEASGISYIDKKTANPMITTTYGTGELIIDALNHDAQEIIIGLGGSATNDGGAGMAQAIGAKLLDSNGNNIAFGAKSLDKLSKIDCTAIDKRLKHIPIKIAADVTNPLTGQNGASFIFGPQKGATPNVVRQLEKNMIHYSTILQESFHKNFADLSGAGAAGGLGAGLMAFTNASMTNGINIIINYTNLKKKIVNADFVFTGEGSVDFQTQFGKTPFGVAKAAKSILPNIPVIVLTGKIGNDIDSLYQNNTFDAVFSTMNGPKNLEQAFKNSKQDISQTAENVARLIHQLR